MCNGRVVTRAEIWRSLDYEFSWRSVEQSGPGGWFLFKTGAEDRGDTPGADFGHEAYTRLRQFAWRYRNSRSENSEMDSVVAMGMIAGWLKERPGVKAEDVDRVIECLKADRCGCPRCRYGV